MLAGGWLDEVRALLDAGYSAELASLSSMGYRELAQHVLGELPLEEAARRIKLAHHRLARQQYTWFKPTDARIRWLVAGAGVEAQSEAVVSGVGRVDSVDWLRQTAPAFAYSRMTTTVQYTWFKPTDARIRWLVAGAGVEAQSEAVVSEWVESTRSIG